MAQNPLSVVMISANFYPHIGGAERQAMTLARSLRSRGLNVSIITRRKKGLKRSETIHGVEIKRLWCFGPGFLNSTSFLISLSAHLILNARSYDIFHVHLASSPAIAASLFGKIFQKPVFVKLGASGEFGELRMSSKTILGRLKIFLLQMLRPSFIALTLEQELEAQRYLGETPLHRIPNGVDLHKFRPSTTAKKILRLKWGLPEGLVFLYTGRFAPQKHLPFFVDAWGEIAKKAKIPVSLALFGEGFEEKVIRKTAEQAGIQKNVYFYPPQNDLASVYPAADIFVLPSLAEGLSNSLLEAMACGLAVLASKVGGNTEAITDGVNGFLFSPDQADEIQAQTLKFIARPGLADEMGRAAHKTVEDSYSIDKIAKRYETIYRLSLMS